MNDNSLYAFYGSLRKGMENHERYQTALDYLFSARLSGFKLYSRGEYPCITRSNQSDSVVIEVFRVTDSVVEKEIHEMEIEDGYFYDEVLINEKKIGIYLFEDVKNFSEVNEGDWVAFFRQRTM